VIVEVRRKQSHVSKPRLVGARPSRLGERGETVAELVEGVAPVGGHRCAVSGGELHPLPRQQVKVVDVPQALAGVGERHESEGALPPELAAAPPVAEGVDGGRGLPAEVADRLPRQLRAAVCAANPEAAAVGEQTLHAGCRGRTEVGVDVVDPGVAHRTEGLEATAEHPRAAAVPDDEEVLWQQGLEVRAVRVVVGIDGDSALEPMGAQPVVQDQVLLPHRALRARGRYVGPAVVTLADAAVVVADHHDAVDGVGLQHLPCKGLHVLLVDGVREAGKGSVLR